MIAIRKLLSLLAVLALILVPLGRPVMGANADIPTVDIHTAGMHAVMSDATAAPMAADMPCCPDNQKSGDCQDCPFVAICLLKVWQAAPAANMFTRRQLAHERLRPRDDVIAASLARPPPDHPPRSLV